MTDLDILASEHLDRLNTPAGPGVRAVTERGRRLRNRRRAIAGLVGVSASALLVIGLAAASQIGVNDDDVLVMTDSADRPGSTDDDANVGDDAVVTSDEVVGVTTTTAATTSTTTAPPTVESVDLDPRLAGIDLTLVGLTGTGTLIELDLSAQTLVRRETGLRSTDNGGLIVGDGWVAIGDVVGANPSTLVIHDDGTSERVDLGEPLQLMWRVGTDRFWRLIDSFDWGGPLSYEEVDLSGQPTGVTLQLPPGSWAWRADPAGGLIVNAAGKHYAVDESSVEYIGVGDLLALSATFAVTRDCDERLSCGLFVTDRLSGEIRQVPLDESLVAALTLTSGLGGRFGAIAPDGSMFRIIVPPLDGSTQDRPSLGLVDLESGAVIGLGATQDPWTSVAQGPSLVWTADSQVAFYLNDSSGLGRHQLVAFDRSSGEHFEVLPADDTWTAFSSRPSGS